MHKDLHILYEDNHIIVVCKPFNIPVMPDSSKDEDMFTIVKNYIKESCQKAGNVYLGIVHRIDRPTGGVMVFAKTSKAASRLSQSIREGEFEKKYLAVTVGVPAEENATLVHYIKKNSITNVVNVVPSATEDAKRAELYYKVLEKVSGKISLLEILLVTGRAHQIRVQLAHIKCPIFGDVKYGGDIAKGYNLALFASRLSFIHPVTKNRMVFIAYPPQDSEPWKRFDIERHLQLIK
jgi:23S rRNA pseudouridine1911/1915/1917 synthase